jgi:hypothetical protein
MCVAAMGDIDSAKCSQDDICTSCRRLLETAQHAHEKRTMSFCVCIRTRVLEVNPFEDSESHK